jgi:hypothetical protein
MRYSKEYAHPQLRIGYKATSLPSSRNLRPRSRWGHIKSLWLKSIGIGCSILRAKLHNHPVPQDVVLAALHESGSMPLSTGLIREDIYDPESELWRIPLLGNPVNKPSRMRWASSGGTMAAQEGRS